MKRIKNFFLSFRLIKTIDQAANMGLGFCRNVYGDEINDRDCRSIWIDEYGNLFRCAELRIF